MKQRDSVSPLLFIIILIKTARDKTRSLQTILGYRYLQAVKIDAPMNVDDIVLMTDSKNIRINEVDNLKVEYEVKL